MTSNRNATRRLLRELEQWQGEQDEQAQHAAAAAANATDPTGTSDTDDADDTNSANRGIERLGTASDGNLFRWEAVLNGEGVGGGYDDGRWLLRIDIPATYPLHPPAVRFATPCLHANVHPETGAVCLDLLADAWTPALSVAACVRAVRLLLAHPGLDSPLNVDVAALLRAGDRVAAAALVRLWIVESRYDGA